jgi:transglutaminase-like putative cysteine protease
MRVSVRHETRYEYDEPVAGAVMRLRLVPPSNAGQSVLNWTVTVNEQPIERWITSGFGDQEALWRAPGRVSEVVIIAEGEVTTFNTAGVSKPIPGEARPTLFLVPTPLTARSPALEAFALSVRSDQGPLDSLHRLCTLVHDEVSYKAGVTSVATTAAEALELGMGVCQDQTHIFIAAARILGIPARYVTGYLRDPERPDNEHDPHAWAEAWVEGIGWIGFDSTLGHCPVEGHVRLTIGLDAADAAPIRGVVSYGGEASLSNDVQIAALPLDGSAQSQTQQ